MSKYKNKKTEIDGIVFDSSKEARRYKDLVSLEKAGKIKNLGMQIKYNIVIGGIPIKIRSARYKNGRQLSYIADFVYWDNENGEEVIEDTKGYRTDAYKIKKALMEAMGHEITEL